MANELDETQRMGIDWLRECARERRRMESDARRKYANLQHPERPLARAILRCALAHRLAAEVYESAACKATELEIEVCRALAAQERGAGAQGGGRGQ